MNSNLLFRRFGAAQWLPGSRSIGQKEFPLRFNKILSGLVLGYYFLKIIIIIWVCRIGATRSVINTIK